MTTTHNENNRQEAACPRCGAMRDITTTAAEDSHPPGVRGWSWGAFLLNVIWAIGNRTWIGLLMFVPYLWFVMPFVLGFKGREWAWQNRRWESVEQFNRVQREWSRDGLISAAIIAVLLALVWPLSAPDGLGVKAKLSKVMSTLDPIKTAVVQTYQDKGHIPSMRTIVTAANQGQPASKDWAALGFERMPSLPPEVKRLEFSAQELPEILVELDNIHETINGSTVRAKLIVDKNKLSWQYESTSVNPVAQRYFRAHAPPE